MHFAKVFATNPEGCRKIIAENSDVVSSIWGLDSEIGTMTRMELKDYYAKNHQQS
jgi:hypothetical protein